MREPASNGRNMKSKQSLFIPTVERVGHTLNTLFILSLNVCVCVCHFCLPLGLILHQLDFVLGSAQFRFAIRVAMLKRESERSSFQALSRQRLNMPPTRATKWNVAIYREIETAHEHRHKNVIINSWGRRNEKERNEQASCIFYASIQTTPQLKFKYNVKLSPLLPQNVCCS